MSAAHETARSILADLQAAVDLRELDRLLALFDEQSVLIGSSGDGRTPEAVRAYLTAVVEQPEALRWEWDEVVPFHAEEGALGFAAFGEVILGDMREPIRLTVFAVEAGAGWTIRQFHGSIPLAG